ncbi:Small ribosomal subunit protein uS17m [Caenorhabditis elegans]|uniref:Small ribosomal subunit protein uS17m n=1 Tax=Caenorhabditis elegans TaxID=6239 RepID=RT17_CAEEL|nr:Small ribosomal subunit protein uS17m [Caenorhabditis elegans]Q11189.2 RecName: Full=Small ribosomal subunit protein uS17m; AltName: Full=28S ribosomal protein S17, mitochondrial; Short=MRP-S17; Short=S17mt [Caenorhabditis elegans]CCD63200.1 Small ribosomal subunit protein uS17m [Caenorhabditis elegans]|eukprot:NP_498409.1 28S ribosomal protein S17, mitochondrial [Caenorhabditis elegans]
MPKTSVWKTRVGTQILMGKITDITQIGIDRIPCAQVRCQMNEFNIYLKKYFARSFDFWALDKTSLGNIGDTVLIKQIDGSSRPKANVSHAVDRVVFKFGNIVDPVTGRKIFNDTFADEIDLKKVLVEEVVDKPLEEESMLFEERRALQIRRLEQEKEANV